MRYKEHPAVVRFDPRDLLAHHSCKVYNGGSGFLKIHCPCPDHEDKNPSCSVNIMTGYALCHGCGWRGDKVALNRELGRLTTMSESLAYMIQASGQTFPELKFQKFAYDHSGPRQRRNGRRIVVASWPYHDTSGRHVFTVQRAQYQLADGSWVLNPKTGKPVKDYLACHPHGRPGLPCEFKDGELRPIYALSEVLASPLDQRIIVVEGEPAADALRNRGHVATTSSGGSGLASKSDWSPLAGRNVVIWPDNDPAGAKYANQVKTILEVLKPPAHYAIADISRLNLPAGGDAVDWVNLRKREVKR